MTAGGTSPADAGDGATAAWRARLHQLLAADDIDGALRAGLMRFPASGGGGDTDGSTPRAADGPGSAHGAIADAQARVLDAWSARERHRARETRLARRDALRTRRREAQALSAAPTRIATRSPAAETADPQAAGGLQDVAGAARAGVPAAAPTTLPPAAADALARALARAAART